MRKLLLVGAGILISASATLFAAQEMNSALTRTPTRVLVKSAGADEDARIEVKTPAPR